MSLLLQWFFNWPEVWALFIPLAVLLFRKRQPTILRPIVIYLFIAFALNLFADIIADYKRLFHFPQWLQSNNPIYNIHSVARFACFSFFFLSVTRPSFSATQKIIVLVFLLFVIINFIFFENFFFFDHLSGNLLSVEAYLLLIYCMLYYLAVLNSDDEVFSRDPAFWVVTGLSIYVVVNFFVFLFYVPMITQNPTLADNMWYVHNSAYIFFCLFITKALYATT